MGVVGGLALLGIFVNGLFLLAAAFSLCGLMHVFGGHHRNSAHAHDTHEGGNHGQTTHEHPSQAAEEQDRLTNVSGA